MSVFDIIVKSGLYFDGTGAPAYIADIGIRDGRIAEVSRAGLDETSAAEVIDAAGKWVTPGFLDTHTHYDAELIVAPGLSESVRHGVTTVLVGSCSLSMVCSEPEDASDIFTRVETVPREYVLPILQQKKTWNRPAEWLEFLKQTSLGPNIISFLGHSDIRVATMGLQRSTDRDIKPTEDEMAGMESYLEEALDHGFLGLSTMNTKWDKIDGDREWSKSLPSTYANWQEVRRLNRLLRARNRIHQGAPDVAAPLQITQYLRSSLGWFRKPLKTTLITMVDLKGNRLSRPLAKLASRATNLFGGILRWQVLSSKFFLYADGIDIVLFEEFGAGQMALHLKDEVERNKLLNDEAYRRRFRKFYKERYSPRVWQRDFGDATILECPDSTLVGRDFESIANERDIHVVDLYLDLVVKFGKQLRWMTVVANDRLTVLEKMVADRDAMIAFSDAGAHIRNMAFYNLPLRMLQLVQNSHDRGKPIMTMEKAVWRMTGEQADWFGIEAGKIRPGDRADLAIIDPAAFNQDLSKVHWAEMENFNGLQRLVNRNADLVPYVLINGRFAVRKGEVEAALGQESGFGQFLPAA